MNARQQNLAIIGSIIDQGRVTEPWVLRAYNSLLIQENKKLEKAVINHILNQQTDSSLTDLPFILPSNQAEITGELDIGRIIATPNLRLKVPKEKLPMHLCTSGSSGFGKSTFALRLAEEAYLNGVESIRIVDPKADEFNQLALKYNDFLVLKWSDLRFNPFTPPPNVPVNEWFQTVVGHCSQSLNFWQGGESLLIRHLNLINQKGIQPSPLNLLKSIEFEKHSFGQKDLFVKATVISRLQMLINLFTKTISTESTMLEQLHNRKVIISTSGLMSEAESWFLEFLLVWEFMFRVYNYDKRELSLCIFDECQHRLFSSEKERNNQKLGSSLISQLVDQSRALNIGICSFSQEPSTLIRAVINNSWLKIAFHLGSGGEIKTVSEAMGLNKEQTEVLHYLEIGEAIVRMASGYMDAMLVKLDNYENIPALNEHDFWGLQQEMKDELYKNSILIDHCSDYTQGFVEDNFFKTKKTKPASDNTDSQEKYHSPERPTSKSNNAVLQLIKVWLNLKEPFITQGQLFEKAGIKSGSTQIKFKKILLKEALIKEHRLQIGKTYASIWEPMQKAYELIDIIKPAFKSKGGYLHQFITYHIKNWAVSRGYSVDIEFFLSNGKAVDLILRKDDTIFIEIGISSLKKEPENLVKDISTDLLPDWIWLVVIDSKSKTKIEELTMSDSRLIDYRDKFTVKLAGDFLKQ